MSAPAPDVVVLGAGIVGACCAWAFAVQGLRVTVVDQAGIGEGATAAGMGHIVLMDDSEPQFDLCRYSQHLWRELRGSLPREVEWTDCGTLWVAADDDEMCEAVRKHHRLAARGVCTQLLDARALAEAEPNLRPGLAGGLLQPEDSAIYAPCASRWLLSQAKAELRLASRVVDIREGLVILEDRSEIACRFIVLATGEAIRSLVPGLPVRPRKGHLAITNRYPGWLHHQIVELGYVKSAGGESTESVAFNVQPRATGQVLIGSSRQYGVETSEVEPRMLGRMLRRSVEYMPGLANLSVIRTWTGFRASTPDKLPVISPHPALADVWIATGHEGLGITMATGTGRLVADAALGMPVHIPILPYSVSRFFVVSGSKMRNS